jgi:hypothetical protein
VIKATTTDPLVYSVAGNYTIHWTLQDGTNKITQTQQVTVSKKADTIRVNPNPTDNEFRIVAEGCGQSQKLTLQVYDMAGRLMEMKQLELNQESRFGSRYPAGVYFVRLMWAEKKFVYKLIKTR